MTTRIERRSGMSALGEMNGKRLAEELEVAHGTVKRWLHEGLPARRDGNHVWIDPATARAWLAERFKGRKTIAFCRVSLVYFAQREDGAIKIGWSSDVMRRVAELRKKGRTGVQLLACVPGDKPHELAMHKRFGHLLIGDEWFRPGDDLVSFIDSLGTRAA